MSSFGLWSLILSIPLGALGWVATNFVARPVLRVFELRERAWEEILVTANASLLDGTHYEQCSHNLRRLAAQAAALDAAWPQSLRWLLREMRVDLHEAAAGLLGVSNTLGLSEDAWGYRLQATRALRLSTDFATTRGATFAGVHRRGRPAT